MDNGNIESVCVRVCRAGASADSSGEVVDVNLTPGPTSMWSPEHIAKVTEAVGIDAHASVQVRLKYADGESEDIPATRGGWLMVSRMKPGEVLVVDSGAAPALSPVPPPPPPLPSLSWMQNRSQQR